MSDQNLIKTIENAGQAPDDPFVLFGLWMNEAQASETIDPNAMCLATVGPDGMPGARILLLKDFDHKGFVFYTNRESDKGTALSAHPVAALNFYWKTLGMQVCIQGNIEQVADSESDAYFATRPRGSRIGAWASRQSQPLESRAALEERVAAFEKKFEGAESIPRPPYWGGYRLRPVRIEFWHAGDFRLHTRLVYRRRPDGESWDKEMLYP